MLFLTSLKYAKTGTKIIFDDYFNRPEYHLVEEFVKPSEACGRQALFIKTTDTDQKDAALDRVIAQFQFIKERPCTALCQSGADLASGIYLKDCVTDPA